NYDPAGTDTPDNVAVEDYASSYQDSFEYGENGSYSSRFVSRWIRMTITKLDATTYSVSTRPFEQVYTYSAICSAMYVCEYDNDFTEGPLNVPAKTASFTLVSTGGVRS